MRAAALLLVAVIGFVNSQQNGNAKHYADRGQIIGASRERLLNHGVNPLGGQQHIPGNTGTMGTGRGNSQTNGNGVNYADQGTKPGGGASRMNTGFVSNPLGGQPQHRQNPILNSAPHHASVGRMPTGGSSRTISNDFRPGTGLGHPNTGMAGQNQQGWGQQGGQFGQPSMNGGQGGFGGPHGGLGYSPDFPYRNNDFTQKETGNPAHSTGGASVGGATAGVVIAVLVVVGIVGVAAVFMIKQRRSRQTLMNLS